jgi:excisionase family DNA binding protein
MRLVVGESDVAGGGRGLKERLTIAEASEVTGLSKRALARRIERGQLAATKAGGLRYIEVRALAQAGLLDPSTGRRPAWSEGRPPPQQIAQELVGTLVRQSIELHELRLRLEALETESRRDDDALREELVRAHRERAELRRALSAAQTPGGER